MAVNQLFELLYVVIQVLNGFGFLMLILEINLLEKEDARVERLSVIVGFFERFYEMLVVFAHFAYDRLHLSAGILGNQGRNNLLVDLQTLLQIVYMVS